MTQFEFERILGLEVTPEQYDVIEYVYTWHPSIKDVGGKDQIAALYKAGGYRLILDMVDTANTAKKLNEKIQKTIKELEQYKSELAALTQGK